MGAGNSDIQFTAGVPQDVAQLRRQLIASLSGKMGQGATPYGGQVAYGFDPLQLQGANIMSNYLYGRGYQPSRGMSAPMSGGGGGINTGPITGVPTTPPEGGPGPWDPVGGAPNPGPTPGPTPGPGPDPGAIPQMSPYAPKNQQFTTLANLLPFLMNR